VCTFTAIDTPQDLKNMDADVIFSKQLKQIEKEKKDKETKLKTQEKKVSS
jgi:translation initiation factor 3 subunit A